MYRHSAACRKTYTEADFVVPYLYNTILLSIVQQKKDEILIWRIPVPLYGIGGTDRSDLQSALSGIKHTWVEILPEAVCLSCAVSFLLNAQFQSGIPAAYFGILGHGIHGVLPTYDHQ